MSPRTCSHSWTACTTTRLSPGTSKRTSNAWAKRWRCAVWPVTPWSPPPDKVTEDLVGLTKFGFDVSEHMLATRFGAGSVRVLCCYTDARGNRWLDPACSVPLPETGAGKKGAFTVGQLRELVSCTVPVRAGSWYGQRLPEANRPPAAWRDSFHLRDLVLLPHPVAEDGTVHPAELGGREWSLDPVRGLVSR